MITIKTKDWKIKNINTILFDKDGTIQDLHAYWGRIIELRSDLLVKKYDLNNEYFEKLCKVMGYSISKKKLMVKGPVGILSRDEVVEKLLFFLKKENINISRSEIMELFEEVHKIFLKEMTDYVQILPGVENLLSKLKNNSVKIAIVTADSEINAKKCMELLKLDKYIDLYVGRESCSLPKTLGVQAEMAVNLLGSKKHNTICIGDAPMDLIMAINAKIKAGIGVVFGQTKANQLSKYSKYVLNSYKELKIN